MRRRTLLLGAAGALGTAGAAPAPFTLHIEAAAAGAPLPHVWEACVGSDHARNALRADWQAQLAIAHRLAGFRSLRFHGVFDDDMGVVLPGGGLSFLYVDQVLDAMLAMGVRPFVELSFMPTAYASSDNTIFWYEANTSPPMHLQDWSQLVSTFARHAIERYGFAEVVGWRFECWNEPNLSFWAGSQAQYLALYRATALALKAVDARLQVGGPATARFGWLQEFLDFCIRTTTPVDFISGHIYADDPQAELFGATHYPVEQVMPRALALMRARIDATRLRGLPIAVTEWSSANPAFIAQTIKDCAGLVDTLSFWTFNNVFEEQGPIPSFDNAQYGLLAQGGVPRPAMHAFSLLHRLGDHRLPVGDGPVLATRRADGGIVTLVWNLIPATVAAASGGNPALLPSAQSLAQGPSRTLAIAGLPGTQVLVTIVPAVQLAFQAAYAAMGRPASPTPAQYAQLREAAALPPAVATPLAGGSLTLTLPPNAIALIEPARA